MNPSVQIIRRSAFKETPWKNGGGFTHEALRVPASGEPFEYRVSVARIEGSGPFSEFAEHERNMVLLEGGGLTLRFGDGSSRTLSAVGDIVAFDGAMPAHCELLAGPCMDLNLMTLKDTAVEAQVWRGIRRE